MRSYLPAFDLRAPASLDEALALLADPGRRWRPFAGGTDLMVQLEAGTLPESPYLGLWKLRELRGITDTGDAFAIGAMTTYTDVLAHDGLRRDFPLLARAAAETGGAATQNRGTLGGNIVNASPAADTPPALLVYDAELEVISARGTRRFRYDTFHQGYKKMDLAADELVARIHLRKRPEPWVDYYRKVGTRRAQAISKMCLAASMRFDRGVVADVRIALGSVAPTVIRARAAEAALRGQTIDEDRIDAGVAALATDVVPIDDIRSTAHYRLAVAGRVLRECLTRAR
ncbi:MAG TPA: FAD binding domain-containing protein [Vicinamibacterales bacterium]|nr:FAD binding domain-containing protein [Vicinamibacterales bacterium]